MPDHTPRGDPKRFVVSSVRGCLYGRIDSKPASLGGPNTIVGQLHASTRGEIVAKTIQRMRVLT